MVMTQHYDYKCFVISDNTIVLIMIFICQYYSSTLSFSKISLLLSIFCHTMWHGSKSQAIAFLSALILSSCLREPACKFIYKDLINSTVYFNMQCSCKNPPQPKYASKQPNLSKHDDWRRREIINGLAVWDSNRGIIIYSYWKLI